MLWDGFDNSTPKQAFLTKNYDENARRADRDPRGIFYIATYVSAPPDAGLVEPLCSSSFSLLTVDCTLAEMEGSDTGATLGVLSLGRRTHTDITTLGSAPSPTQHDVLHGFCKNLLNPKDRL